MVTSASLLGTSALLVVTKKLYSIDASASPTAVDRQVQSVLVSIGQSDPLVTGKKQKSKCDATTRL